jgi:hypothetical protein
MRSFKIAFAVICLLGAANLAIAATLEVSQPTQVTNDTYYERGQSIVYDGADYWLFYGRSATVTGPYSSQNPDVNDYATYYKKASSVPALASATAAAVLGATNGYLGETGAAYFGGEVWTFAPVDLTTQADVFGWYWNGATWTQVASMVTGLSTGSAHHDEIAFNGELFVMVRRGSDFFTTHTATPKTGGWSTEVAVGSAGGLAHFYEEGGTLYLAVLKSPAPRENQIFQYNVGPDTWTLVDSAPSTGWDPTLFKVGGTYVFAQAPWTSEGGGRQYVIGWSGSALGTLLSGGTPIDIVEGRYGANTWIDMWPIGFTDAGGTSYMFYTSERDVPSAEGTGNIWYLEVDWDVSGDHYTYIQEAIGASGSGDVIDVAAGTYEENITVSTPLTLNGANAGVDARGRSATETIVTAASGDVVTSTTSDVTIDGVTLDGGGASKLVAVDAGLNFTLQNNIMTGTVADAVWFGTTSSDVTIHQNEFLGSLFGSYGLFFDGGSDAFDNLVISDNNFYSADMFAGAKTYNSNNMLMSGNLFDGSYANLSSAFDNSTITQNTFRNNGYTNMQVGLKNGTISQNTFEDTGPSPNPTYPSYSLMFWGDQYGLLPSENVTVENNTFYFNGFASPDELAHGLRILSGIDATTITVFDNSFVDGGQQTGAMAVVNQATGTADASANWWSSNNAANVKALANAGVDVDFTPWLEIGADTEPGTPGFQGYFEVLSVDDDSPQAGATGRIQEGVDLVTTSTVNIMPGTYEEQVEIDKSMALIGAGMGVTTIQAPVSMTKFFVTSANNYPVIFVHDANAVTVTNLTVDGLGRGNTNTRFHGIAYRNAGGTVSSCEIKDIRDTPFSGAQHGVAMYVYNDDLASRSITVSDCVISGFQKNAMALNAGATTPLVVDVTGNTVTGAGATDVTAQNGIQVWADLGIGSVTGNTVTDVAYDNTANPTKYVASSFLNYYADVDFDDNVVADGHVGIYNIDGAGSLSGNTIDIVKVGVYAFGIIASDPPRAVPTPYEDFGSGAQSVSGRGIQWAPAALLNVDVSGNTVSFSGPDNTATYGIEADAGWGPNDMAVTANNNTVDGFEVGIEVYTCQSGCYAGVFTSVTAQYNDVSTSTLYGIRSNVSSIVTDGRYNYWGDATGPYHATLNPLGTGVPVSDYVLFNPWMVSTNEIAIEPTPVYTNCTTNTFVTFTIDQSGAPHQVRGYDVTFTVDGTYATVVGFTQEDYLLNVSSTAFYTVDNTGGSWTVSCAILGGTSGATGSGDLFTIELQPQGSNEGTSAISITSVQVRDPDNVFLPDGSVDGSLVLDCTVPTMEPIAEAEGGYYNVAPSFSNFGFDDDVALDAGEYKTDAGTWVTIFSGLGLPEYNDDGWTLPGFAGLSQGSHTVYFRVSDLAGNVNGEGIPDTYSWQFNKDTVPPAPPTNFVAMPGHEKTHLTWTNPTGDATWDGVEVRRARWYDYPQYSAPAPAYPADESEGELVVQTSGTAHDDDPLVPPAHSRDIYYYSAFSYDLAGNYSVFDAGATDRATNYWLGDIDSTGTVATLDLVVFSGTYGESEGSPGFVPESDFGPSDDWSRFGIPLPDDIVQFEDLMIFAMNYGNVTPAGVSGRHLAERLEPLSEKVSFSFLPAGDSGDDGTVMVSIVINNDASVLKGMRLTIDYGAGNELVRVDKGSLLRKGSDTFLGTMGAESGRVYVDVAALGVERAFDESGEIARVIVRPRDDQPVTVKLVEADLRDVNNESDVVEESGSGDTFVPTVSALHQNHPNPFNPTTTLTYDVATPGAVSVRIYDVSGKLVRTLVDEFKTTGRYELSWDGRNNNGTTVTTGVYFYRMTAPGFASHTRKMLLLK